MVQSIKRPTIFSLFGVDMKIVSHHSERIICNEGIIMWRQNSFSSSVWRLLTASRPLGQGVLWTKVVLYKEEWQQSRFYRNRAQNNYSFASLKWFRKVHVHYAFLINKILSSLLIYKYNFTFLLICRTYKLTKDKNII